MGKDFKEKPRMRLVWDGTKAVYQQKVMPEPAMKKAINIASGEDVHV
jgi:hypothetical protein